LRPGEIPKEMPDMVDAGAIERLKRIAGENDKAKPFAVPRALAQSAARSGR
jgi:hypothetical protein